MKHIKTYENNNELSVGDYVVIQDNEEHFSSTYNYFLKYHIGVVNRIEENFFYCNFIISKEDYFSTITEFSHNQVFRKEEIKFYSKSLKEIKIKIDLEKYNL